MAITISTRTIGQRRPLLADFEVPPPDDLRDDGDLLLRHVIEHVVRQQVRQFNLRQEAGRFDRVLSQAQIEAGAKVGRISPEARTNRQPADEDQAVATALRAFEDGLYLIIIDDVERRRLDEPVYLSPNSRLLFIRLTFLSGAQITGV